MDLNIKNTPKRIKKKDAILDSAVAIFSKHGYENTKLEQITRSLSLTDKSIYYYFSSKGDLFIEVVRLVQNKLDILIQSINETDINHLEKIKLYTAKAMTIKGLTLLMELPKSLSEFARYDEIKTIETRQYKVWTNWFKKGQLEGSMIQGNASQQRNFLLGSLFHLHSLYSIKDQEAYSELQPLINNMIDRMFSTKFGPLK
jgi:AcrR family transcriptional regulator